MPRRRSPKVWQERVVGAIESMIPGTVGGRIANAGPIGGESSSARASIQGGVATVAQAGSDSYFEEDPLTLTADGAQDVALTYEPVEFSEDVEISGLAQTRGVDWTRDGQTLSLLTAMDARAGEVLTVQYAIRSGAPVDPSLPVYSTLVDWNATGWKYNETTWSDSTDYSASAFDDSAWSTGQAAFGSGTGPTPKNTTWPLDGRIWIRRTVPDVVTAMRITVRIDNYATVWINGTQVADPVSLQGADDGTLEKVPFDVDPSLLNLTGNNVIAVMADDDAPVGGGDVSFIDVKIEGVV